MFETLSDRLGNVFRNLSGRGRLSEENVREAMADVRTALLEADVHLDVVKAFCDDVLQDALGADVTKSLKPGQEMVGIVHQRLIDLVGPVDSHVMMVEPAPTVIMMCGLQGSGKTTTCAKLAAYLKARGKNTMIAAADLQRPAAVEQLRRVTEQVAESAKGNAAVHFYAEPGEVRRVRQGRRCRRRCLPTRRPRRPRGEGGRAHPRTRPVVCTSTTISWASSRASTAPSSRTRSYLVVDAMIGQDAVNSARAFHERLAIDGVILTKFDSDTRGGAVLSVKSVTGAPIKFIGVGEKFDALEEFHPERVAGRILGMGDVVSLVEKAQEEVSEEEAEQMAAKMAEGRLTMDDFLKQLRSIRRMGPMKQILGMLPGVGSALKDVDVDEKQLDRLEGIVRSMTTAERDDIKVLNKSRVRRISRGSGTSPADVNKLTKQFEMIQKMTRQMSGKGALGKMKAMKELASAGPDMMPGMQGLPGFGGRASTKTASVKSGFKQRKRKKQRR